MVDFSLAGLDSGYAEPKWPQDENPLLCIVWITTVWRKAKSGVGLNFIDYFYFESLINFAKRRVLVGTLIRTDTNFYSRAVDLTHLFEKIINKIKVIYEIQAWRSKTCIQENLKRINYSREILFLSK